VRTAGADDQIRLRCILDDSAARRERYLGSPTVRIDGRDVGPGASDRLDFGMKCRLYATGGGLHGTPLDEWILNPGLLPRLVDGSGRGFL
jgi:hypothetical protein